MGLLGPQREGTYELTGKMVSRAATPEFRAGWELMELALEVSSPPRTVRPHDCERCGRHMEFDDQECACLARR